MKIIRDEGGDDVLFAVRNNKEVVGACFSEVVLPPRAWEDAWLRTIGTWSLSFGISIHSFEFYVLRFGLLVQDHSHGGDRGRGTRWDCLNVGGFDGRVIGGVGSRSDWWCD